MAERMFEYRINKDLQRPTIPNISSCTVAFSKFVMLPVGHELKLSIRRNEGDRSVVFKSGQSHALMELHILKLHALTLSSS